MFRLDSPSTNMPRGGLKEGNCPEMRKCLCMLHYIPGQDKALSAEELNLKTIFTTSIQILLKMLKDVSSF